MKIPEIVNQLREEENLGILSCKSIRDIENLKTDNISNDHLNNCNYLIFEEKIDDVVVNKNKEDIVLKELEKKFEDIALCSADWIWEVDKNGVYTFCSNRIKDILGYTSKEIIGKTPFDFMCKDEVKRVKKIFNKIVANKEKIKDLENWNICKNGERICLLTNGIPLFDKKGFLKGYRGVDKDITEKKKFEDELKNKEKFLSDIFNSIGDGLSVLDKDLNVIRTNRFMEEMYSNKMPFIGKKCYKIYQNRDTICPWCPSLKAMEIKKTQVKIVPYPDDDNPDGWLNLSSYPLIDNNGDVWGVIEYVKDITNQISTQKELEGISKKLKNIIDSSPSAIITSDEKGIINSWNPASEEIFGWNADEIIGKFNPTIPKDMKDSYFRIMREKVTNIEFKALTKNKKMVDINLSSAPLFNNNNYIGSICIMTDITEKNRIKDNLEKSKEHFRNLFNTIVDPLVIVNSSGKFLEITDKVEEITGYKKNELIGENFLKTKIVTRKSKLVLIKNLVKRMSGLSFSPYEIEVITKEGTKIPYEVNACKIDYMGKPADMVIFRDVTERKKAQEELHIAHEKLKMMNEHLEEKVKERTIKIQNLLKQKNEFINQLGHDLKNPLNPIVNLLPVVEKNENNPESRHLLKVVIRNVDYMKNLVVKTIELARLNASNLSFSYEDVNLLDKVDSVVENNKQMFEDYNVVVNNKIKKDLFVKVDKLRIEELFNNIINNAVKYSPNGGEISIDAEEDKDFIIVSVKDSGIGMTKEQIDRIFDEFYKADSSRHDFDSTGLGLTICRRIIERHGGRIWAESPGEGYGSTMFFTIPKSIKN